MHGEVAPEDHGIRPVVAQHRGVGRRGRAWEGRGGVVGKYAKTHEERTGVEEGILPRVGMSEEQEVRERESQERGSAPLMRLISLEQ